MHVRTTLLPTSSQNNRPSYAPLRSVGIALKKQVFAIKDNAAPAAAQISILGESTRHGFPLTIDACADVTCP